MTKLTVLSGPSGVGKSTLIETIRKTRGDIWVSVSATTRPPRSGEVEGEHYFFVSTDQFAQMRTAGEFLESAEFAGNWYGTPRVPVLEHLAAGTPVVLEIDLAGARQVRAAMPESQLVFLAPPSWEQLVARLTGRGTEDPEVLAKRLQAAEVEMAAQGEFDATVVNDSLERATARLISLLGLPEHLADSATDDTLTS
ncbi:MAG: guanylate kinase [Actinobacteria bacterium]|nr:guanylate kinase [Actinomycetota bacterium]